MISKRGVKVPESTMEKLRFSKTLIKVLEMDPDTKEIRNKTSSDLPRGNSRFFARELNLL